MYQEQTQQSYNNPKNSIPPQQLQTLTQSCQYISHIIFPYSTQQLLEDTHTRSLMHIAQQINNPIHTEIQLELYEQHLYEHAIDFSKICVQVFYFMFGCMKKKYRVEFHQELFVFCGKMAKFMVVIKEVVRDQEEKDMAEDDRYYMGLYFRVVRGLIAVIEQCLEYLERRVQDLRKMGDAFTQNQIKQRQAKIHLITLKQKYIKNILRPLQNYLTDIEHFHKKIPADYQSFIQLQKCQFLTNNSILYKIRNRSINVYLFNHNKPQNRQKLFLAIRNQKKLIKDYHNAKMLFNTNKQQLNDICRKINVNFEKYVQQGWSGNPIYIRYVANQQNVQNQQKINMSSNTNSKFCFRLKLKSITQKSQPKQQKLPNTLSNASKILNISKEQALEYQVDYNTTKPCLMVRLLTPLNLQPYNVDQQLHNWNCLTYETLFTSIEIGQKMQPNAKIRKHITIKSICQFRYGDSVLAQFLKLVDTTMSVYKVIEQIIGDLGEDGLLTEYRFKDAKDINKQIDHYSKLMGELTRRLYGSIV